MFEEETHLAWDTGLARMTRPKLVSFEERQYNLVLTFRDLDDPVSSLVRFTFTEFVAYRRAPEEYKSGWKPNGTGSWTTILQPSHWIGRLWEEEPLLRTDYYQRSALSHFCFMQEDAIWEVIALKEGPQVRVLKSDKDA